MAEQKKSAAAARLENLRGELSMTWTELAVLLGVSRKYLFMLRAGTRHLGPGLERKLREVEAGAREKYANMAGTSGAANGNTAGTAREDTAGYGMTDNDRLVLDLARENAGLKARLADLDARLKRLEGRDGG